MNVTTGIGRSEQQSLFSGIGMRLSSGGTAQVSAGGRENNSSSTSSSTKAGGGNAGTSSTRGGRSLSASSVAWSRDSSSPSIRSPTRSGRAAEKDRIISLLELERDALMERCATNEKMVRDLKLEMNKLLVRAHNKKDLRKKFNWNGVDTTYSDGVIKFCKEWLFPRYKFLHDDWMIYSEDRKSLSSLVLKHCAVPDGADREDAWNRIVAPTIAKKYADMRCNINNEVRKAFQGKKLFYHYF